MFVQIFLFELKYRIKRPATWIYFLVFLSLAFLYINITGGAFKEINLVLGNAGKVNANSPFNVNALITFLSFFSVLVISAIMGNPIYRDFEHDTHSLFYTKPITKLGYMAGRFLGSFVITLMVLSSIGLGIMLGSLMPWLDPEKIGPFMIMSYVQPYLVFVIPNILFTGAIFFTLASLTRNILSTYIGSVLFLVLYGVSSSLLASLDNQTIAGLLDPLGRGALRGVTKYWTTFEKNNLQIPLSGKLLANRVIWFLVGMLILAFAYIRFRFTHHVSSRKPRRVMTAAQEEIVEESSQVKLSLPSVKQQFTNKLFLSQLWSFTIQEFKGIVKSVYFIAIIFAGMVLLFANGSQIGKIYDTPTYPVTYQVIDLLGGTFNLFMLIIVIFYSGELVWKERTARVNQIMDAMPVQGSLPFMSKLFALMLVQVLMLVIVMLSGILIQTAKGYYNYELDLYVKGLFGFGLIDWLLTCVLAMMIQTLVNDKFVGHFVMVLYYIFTFFQGQLGIEHNLARFSSDTGVIYSDMNGYGSNVFSYFMFKLYWGGFTILLAVVAHLFWVRGTEATFRIRRKLAAQKFKGKVRLVTLCGALIFLGCGSFIYYNTNVLNKYTPSGQQEKQTAEFEKKYRKYKRTPQPKITGVKLNVDIYPDELNLFVKGTYRIKNKGRKPIDSVIVNIADDKGVKKMDFGMPASLVFNDKEQGFRIYRLSKPLSPGDSTTMSMELEAITQGFANGGVRSPIEHNGTFINNFMFPSFGYNEAVEIGDDDARKKRGLPPKERVASVYDTAACMINELSQDADWIDYECVISTVPDQIAVSPGYLLREWTENGRRYFHYKMDTKILNFYSFLSARYEVKRDVWKDPAGKQQNVNIEIFYHKGHEYNLDRMITSIKRSLDYFTKNFSPYQHKQVRILEFPRPATFAQSFPNTIPYSEAIGFIAEVDPSDPEDVDFPFYVTAHEVAHQWWGHQVIGGNVQGGAIMVETLAQYSALMVMEHEYGKEKMKKFLSYEMDRYLRGRASERKKEMPLVTMEGQQYLHYNKGSVVMYALKDYIGEDSLNAALARYIKKAAFQEPPYTTSLEFVDFIRKATPDSLKPMIHDMFESIVLFENLVSEANFKKMDNGKFNVKFKVESKKFVADSLGDEKEIPVNDWIDIAILTKGKGKNGEMVTRELYFAKRKITKALTEFEIIVDDMPLEAGIDPYNKLIDRHPDDNVRRMGAFTMMTVK